MSDTKNAQNKVPAGAVSPQGLESPRSWRTPIAKLDPDELLALGCVDGQGPGITATAQQWAALSLEPKWLGTTEY